MLSDFIYANQNIMSLVSYRTKKYVLYFKGFLIL